MFKKELKFYNNHKSEYLSKYLNLFLIIRGNELLGAYDTEEAAYEAGLAKYGQEKFLIKKVEENEPVANFPALYVGVKNASL